MLHLNLGLFSMIYSQYLVSTANTVNSPNLLDLKVVSHFQKKFMQKQGLYFFRYQYFKGLWKKFLCRFCLTVFWHCDIPGKGHWCKNHWVKIFSQI